MPKKSNTTGTSGVATDAETRASSRAKKTIERFGFGEGLKPTIKRSKGSGSPSKSKASKSGSKKSGKGSRPKKHKSKKDKDPDAPKKPLTGFFLFSKDNRERLTKEHPEFKITQIGKLLGEEWGLASDAEKKKYSEKAEKLKKQYEKDLAEYKEKKGITTDKEVKSPKKESKKEATEKKAKK